MNKKFFITVLACIGVFASVGAGIPESSFTVEHIPDQHISKSFHFDSAKVLKYDDNPFFIPVNVGKNQDESDFVIDRSFKDELRVNIDKETISRMAGN